MTARKRADLAVNQADCSLVTDRKICPLMSKLNPDKFGEVHPVFCLDKCCAWWTGTECAVVAIAKRGRGVDVLIKPPAVPGL